MQANASHREVDDESWTVVREELHRQASHVRTIEAANAKMNAELTTLRQRHANIEILKEQKRDLEQKVRGVEELRETVAKLEAELEAARKEREEWCVLPCTCVALSNRIYAGLRERPNLQRLPSPLRKACPTSDSHTRVSWKSMARTSLFYTGGRLS